MKHLSTDKFEELDTRLDQELHADRGVAFRESVRRFAPKIQQLREQGVPFARIIELLKESGLVVSATTLRSYLRSANKAAARTGKSRGEAATPSRAAAATPPTDHTPRAANPRVHASPPATPHLLERGEGGRKEQPSAPATAGHFTVNADSERI